MSSFRYRSSSSAEHHAAPAFRPCVYRRSCGFVIENEAYFGRVIWRGESLPGLHEPLLDELTFQRAQRLLRALREDAALRRGNPGDYPLSGLLRCGPCRRAHVGMSARGNRGLYHYNACSGRQKLGRKGCDGERIPRDKLETAVVQQLSSLYGVRCAPRRSTMPAPSSMTVGLTSKSIAARSPTRPDAPNEPSTSYYAAFESGEVDAKRFQERVCAQS